MSIVSEATPRCSISASALVRVRWVVPKPGMVRPWISAAVEAEHVARRDRDQQRERGIESAGDPDIQRRAGRELLDSLGQPRALDAEDLGAAAVQARVLPPARTACPARSRFRPSHGPVKRERNARNGSTEWTGVVEAGGDRRSD